MSWLFMGDRWSFPKQASAATYVWQPLTIDGTSISIPDYQEAWQINTATGQSSVAGIAHINFEATDARINYAGNWQQDTLRVKSSATKGASFTMKFNGTQIGLYGLARPDGGYARVTLRNSRGKTMLSAVIDMYCQYPVPALKFLSPLLPKDIYTITVSVLGENWYWVNKAGTRSGSKGYVVSLDKMVVSE